MSLVQCLSIFHWLSTSTFCLLLELPLNFHCRLQQSTDCPWDPLMRLALDWCVCVRVLARWATVSSSCLCSLICCIIHTRDSLQMGSGAGGSSSARCLWPSSTCTSESTPTFAAVGWLLLLLQSIISKSIPRCRLHFFFLSQPITISWPRVHTLRVSFSFSNLTHLCFSSSFYLVCSILWLTLAFLVFLSLCGLFTMETRRCAASFLSWVYTVPKTDRTEYYYRAADTGPLVEDCLFFTHTHTLSLSPQPLGRCTINPLTHEFSHFYELCREETTEQQCHCQMWNRTARESKWERKRAWDTRPKRTKVILHCNVPGSTHTWTHKSVHRVSIHGHLHLMFLSDAASRCQSWLPIKE